MNDLKSKIIEIQAKSRLDHTTNIYYEITKVALERNELDKLLSADSSYVYDLDGKAWLAGSKKWYGMSSSCPILENTIINALQQIYEETKSTDIEKVFISTIKEMLYGTPTQFYLAIAYFSFLSEQTQSRSCDYWKFDYFGRGQDEPTIDNELRPFIKQAILQRRDFLESSVVYENNLLEMCEYFSNKLINRGLIGFMPDECL
jgi:hypothetical protein